MYKNFLFSSVKNNKALFFIAIIVLLLILLLLLFFLFKSKDKSRESFTPGLRMIYRPYIRSMRRHTTDVYKKMTDRTRIFLSKMKII